MHRIWDDRAVPEGGTHIVDADRGCVIAETRGSVAGLLAHMAHMDQTGKVRPHVRPDVGRFAAVRICNG